MPVRRKLNAEEIEDHLGSHPDWGLREDKLHADFDFSDFIQAFGFMTRIALVAERMNHHPEWFNVYNRVSVDLSTHDVGGISISDFELARVMSEEAKRAG